MDTKILDERARRLVQARKAAGFRTAKAAAERHGFNYNTYSQHERGLVGLTRSAHEYARAFRVSEGWLLTGEQPGEAPKVRVPLLGTAAGAAIGASRPDAEPIDWLVVPPGLVGVENAYAILVKGNSMSPEHKEGDLRFVNPVKRPVSGDTVIVQQQMSQGAPIEAFIKRFLHETEAEIITEQLDPLTVIRFPRSRVVAVHKVATMNELFRI